VTAQQVQDVAARWLQPRHRAVVAHLVERQENAA
jgi:hypothetical protein